MFLNLVSVFLRSQKLGPETKTITEEKTFSHNNEFKRVQKANEKGETQKAWPR